MRKDPGVSGDAQRIEQLGWMISFKILDDKDKEIEILNDKYVSPMPKKLQWRAWAADDEGITGDELKNFIDSDLIPRLKNLDVSSGNKRALIIREIFDGTNNYMKNGTIIRQVLNELNQIDFNNLEDQRKKSGTGNTNYQKALRHTVKRSRFRKVSLTVLKNGGRNAREMNRRGRCPWIRLLRMAITSTLKIRIRLKKNTRIQARNW